MARQQSTAGRDRLMVAALILGAGSSRRMGTPKLLLPWGRSSIVGHLMRQCQLLGAAQVAIVIASEAVELRRELDSLKFPRRDRILNLQPERGMFGSIQRAARWRGWNKSLTHWLILLGDQPHLRLATFRQLIDFAAQHREKVCQPQSGLRWRHPVVLPKQMFRKLRSSNANTLREFLLGCERAGFECRDPGLDNDIDTPEDYQKIRDGISAGHSSPV